MLGWLFGKKKDGDGPAAGVEESRELFSLTRTVDAPVERAFETFVDKIGAWWPRDYTWSGDQLDALVIEPRYGGRALERRKDGSVEVWGKVLAFDRPRHIVIAWQIRPDRTPEPEEGGSSRVDVRFASRDDGRTDILLVHRDFPRHGEGWEKYKAQMAGKEGWPRLLDSYAAAVKG
ncbi:MAG: SRPBCC family protein [Rhizobiales bacterium]|nr:SRPBCC family protein [Hyphomicrobiales bacterium]MBN9008857.1 SRPBCC family protein [Hyphomicrobiales bacterium]